MTRKIFATSLSLITLFVFFSSCIKGDIISEPQDISGRWAVTGIRSDVSNDWDGDGDYETDIYSTYSYCQRDIILIFDEYGTGEARQGCNARWQHLNWQLSNANRTLRIDMLDELIELNNLQVDYNTIRGEDRVYSNGKYYTIRYTLQRR